MNCTFPIQTEIIIAGLRNTFIVRINTIFSLECEYCINKNFKENIFKYQQRTIFLMCSLLLYILTFFKRTIIKSNIATINNRIGISNTEDINLNQTTDFTFTYIAVSLRYLCMIEKPLHAI